MFIRLSNITNEYEIEVKSMIINNKENILETFQNMIHAAGYFIIDMNLNPVIEVVYKNSKTREINVLPYCYIESIIEDNIYKSMYV